MGTLVLGPPSVLYLLYYINIGLISETELKIIPGLPPRPHYVDNTETKYILTWCEAYGSQKYGWEFGDEKFRQISARNSKFYPIKKDFFSEASVQSQDASSLPTRIIWAQSQILTPSSSIRDPFN